MTQLTFGYSDSEDRMWLRMSSCSSQIWLTRRLCAAVITHLIEAMRASCASGLAPCNSLAPDQRLALEHETANEFTAEPGTHDDATSKPLPAADSSHLLSAVNLSVDARQVRLAFIAPGLNQKLSLSRAESHHLLSALAGRCAAAHWNLPGLPHWLQAEQHG